LSGVPNTRRGGERQALIAEHLALTGADE
jgi:hypothetical protein